MNAWLWTYTVDTLILTNCVPEVVLTFGKVEAGCGAGYWRESWKAWLWVSNCCTWAGRDISCRQHNKQYEIMYAACKHQSNQQVHFKQVLHYICITYKYTCTPCTLEDTLHSNTGVHVHVICYIPIICYYVQRVCHIYLMFSMSLHVQVYM